MEQKTVEQLDKLAKRLDNSGLAEYVRLSQNLPRILWLNFLSGVAKGLGFTVGTAIVLGVVYKIIKRLIEMNIPYLQDLLMHFMEIIQGGGAST